MFGKKLQYMITIVSSAFLLKPVNGSRMFSNYCSISRTKLPSTTIVSLYPSGWMVRAIKKPQLSDPRIRIKELIFTPSLFSLNLCDEVESAIYDEHFCSRLCDKGFVVHIIDLKNKINHLEALKQAVEWRVKECSIESKSIALVANEIATPHLLNYLSEIVSPFNPSFLDIGAVVLLDPPSINSLWSEVEKQKVLYRYYRPLFGLNFEKKKKKKKKSHKKKIAESCLYEDDIKKDDYVDRIRSKGDIGRYLFELSKNPLKEHEIEKLFFSGNDSLIENDKKIKTDDYTEELDLFLKYSDKTIDTEKERKEEIYKIINSSYKRKMNLSYLNQEDEEENTFNMITTDMILGSRPSHCLDVGAALKDRILIVSTLFKPNQKSSELNDINIDNERLNRESIGESKYGFSTDTYTQTEGFNEDLNNNEWGHNAVEEVATLYQAGPVIYIDPTESTKEDSLEKSVEDSESRWSETDRIRHEKIADVLSDWLHLLSDFKYLK